MHSEKVKFPGSTITGPVNIKLLIKWIFLKQVKATMVEWEGAHGDRSSLYHKTKWNLVFNCRPTLNANHVVLDERNRKTEYQSLHGSIEIAEMRLKRPSLRAKIYRSWLKWYTHLTTCCRSSATCFKPSLIHDEQFWPIKPHEGHQWFRVLS